MAAMQCKFAPLLAGIMTDALVPIFEIPSRRLQYKIKLVLSVQMKVRPDDLAWNKESMYSALLTLFTSLFMLTTDGSTFFT